MSLPAKSNATAVTHLGCTLTNWTHRPNALRRSVCPRKFVGNDLQIHRSVNPPANTGAAPTTLSGRPARSLLMPPCFHSGVFLFETLPRRRNRRCLSDTPTVFVIGRSSAFRMMRCTSVALAGSTHRSRSRHSIFAVNLSFIGDVFIERVGDAWGACAYRLELGISSAILVRFCFHRFCYSPLMSIARAKICLVDSRLGIGQVVR